MSTRPKVGDIVHYSGQGASGPWVERREEKIPYIVVDTAYDDKNGHSSALCFLKGSDNPEGRWNLNEWFTAAPENLTILQVASYETVK